MKTRSFLSVLHFSEDVLASLSLFLIALFPVLEVFARGIFHTGIHSSTEYVKHLVIFITFLGAMITSRQDRHLCFAVGIEYISSPFKEWIRAGNALVSVVVSVFLFVSSMSFVTTAFTAADKLGFFPLKWAMYVVPLGFFIMLVRFIGHAPKGIRFKIIAVCGVGIAALLGYFCVPYLHILYGPIIIVLAAGLFLGTPVFVVIGGLSLLFFGASGGSFEIIPNEAYTLLTGPTIPAIPLFTLAGFILSESKAGERLVRLFRELFGWLPGGLGIAAVLICTFFTSLTGASGVTVLALGGILSYVLLENGYKTKFATGLVTVSGVGTLFPPSMPVIMYGIIAQINIKHLFIGAFFPGCIMVLALAAYVMVTAKKEKIKRVSFNAKRALLALRESIGEVLLPVLVLFVFFKGICTLVESAAIAVLYSLVVETMVTRDIHPKRLLSVCVKSMPVMGGVLILLGIAMGLSYYLVDAEIPQNLAAWTQQYIHSKLLFLLVLNLLLIVAASIMDVYGAIIVIAPLVIPLGRAYGIDPVHLGVIFLANLELGYLTPPLGLNLFLSSFRFNQPLLTISRYIVPFFIVLFIALMVITYVPAATTGIFPLLHINR
jgi:C4-dicarboxylate transporter DctM subunit